MESDTILSMEDMKKISHEIIEEELGQPSIELNVFPLTFVEYYNDYVFNKKYNLIKKAPYSTIPLIADGFNDLEGNIIIFLNRINKIEKIEHKIFRLAQICYHEARHSMQQKFDKYSYNGFLKDIDHFLKTNIDYTLEHNKYSFEIGANLYAVRKAKEYLETKYPDLYKKHKDEIEKLEKKYQFDYMTYDASDTVERAIQMLKVTNKIGNNKIIKGKSKKEISPVLEIFLNEDASFKNFSEIVQNEKFKELDKRIVYAILSSKSFLEQINMNQLSIEELEIVNKSLQYTSTLYKNQSKLIEQSLSEKNITYLEYLKSQKSLIKKINIIDAHYTRKLLDALNFMRSDKKREKHMESIQNYLEKSHLLIKQRDSKGYLSITMFYIIGMLISISTIIYILISKY